MSDHPNGQPESGEELDAWLNEGLEESVRASCAQDPAASICKPEPQQSVSKPNPPGNSTPVADPKPEPSRALPKESELKSKPVNPSYVKVPPLEEELRVDLSGGQSSDEHYLDPELVESSFPYPELDTVALHGPLGEIVKAIEPFTEADLAAMLVQLLVCFGNLIGRSAYFYAGDQRHFTNLFACIVGKTAKARKGSSLSAVRRVLDRIDPVWNKERMMSGLSSGEGLDSHD